MGFLSRFTQKKEPSKELVEAVTTVLRKKGAGWAQLWGQAREELFGGSELREPFKQHVWVHACCTKIARNVGVVPLMFSRNKVPLTRRMKNGVVLDLFSKADPWLTGPMMWERTVLDMLTRGNAFWLPLASRAGTPVRFKVLQARKMQPIYDTAHELAGWRYDNKLIFKPEELIHFPYIVYDIDGVGFAPLEVARRTAETDYKSLLWLGALFDNQAEPGGVLSTDQELADEDVQMLVAQFEARHKGPENARKVLVADKGLEYSRIAYTAEEMEYLGLRKYTREDICTAFGVHPGLLGSSENVNYATQRGLKRLFWEETIWPLLHHIEAHAQVKVLDKYFPGVGCHFDTKEIMELQRDIPQEVKTGRTLLEMGFSPNEVNEWMRWGFDEVPERDIHLFPGNLTDFRAGEPGRPQEDPAYDGPSGGEPPPSYDDTPPADSRALLSEFSKHLSGGLSKTIFKLRGRAVKGQKLDALSIESQFKDFFGRKLGPSGLSEFIPAAVQAVRPICQELAVHLEHCENIEESKTAFNFLANRSKEIAEMVGNAIAEEMTNGQVH